VPYPADYGGVVDLFYKLKALHKEGIAIHLHCFTQGRPPQQELNKYCLTVNYYRRQKTAGRFSFSLPFIVNSRRDDELIKRLTKDNHPVLLEGIHCTYYLYNKALNNRRIIVRLHNAEFEYYSRLSQHEKNIFKKLYYRHESRLLKKYEQSLADKATFVAVSKADAELYKTILAAKHVEFLPVFTGITLTTSKTGSGCYCLYHGNLSVNENEEAATWLLKNVVNELNIPLVIAGKNPSAKLQRLAHANTQTCLVANPTETEMQDLIAKAQVNILPSLNNTGVKLKLIHAVFSGRHCLVNKAGVDGSALETACTIAESVADFKEKITVLYNQPFTEDEIEKRNGLLNHLYNDEANAKKLIEIIWRN
jgi:hypothetical protein